MTTGTTPDETSEPAPVRRNPGPRPALRFEGDERWVVAARPLPGQAGEDAPDRTATRRKGKGEKADKGSKRDKTGKDRHRRKVEKKKGKDLSPGAGGGHGSDERQVTVTLPPEFRRALERAAGEHGLTPEGLAAFVLVEWLDR